MNKEESVKLMTDKMAKFVGHIGKKLPDDVIAKLEELAAQETAPLPKVLYETMTKNQGLAVSLDRPSCQDTGVLQFWVKCGTNFPLINELEGLLKEAVVQATFATPLRHNSVETFHHLDITLLKHLTSTTLREMLVRELQQYSGISFLMTTTARYIHTWQAAAVHFQVRQWFLCQVQVMKE